MDGPNEVRRLPELVDEESEFDLSAGKVDEVEALARQGEIEEDSQRRNWKTYVFWGSVAIAVAFYGVAIWLSIFHYLLVARQPYALAILLAVPTLIVIQLIKLVRPQERSDPEEVAQGPWFSLARELVDALKIFLQR